MNTFKKTLIPIVYVFIVYIFTGCSSSDMTMQKKADPVLVKKVEEKLKAFAAEIEMKNGITSEAMFPMLKQYLNDNRDIYGAAFAFTPVEVEGKIVKSSPYVYRNGENLIEKDLIDSYDYTAEDQQWYVLPVKMGKAVWCDPYFDAGGGEAWMVTYSVPVYAAGSHTLVGIVTSDILIPEQK